MTANVKVYKSSDQGAPNTLSGTSGTLLGVLDACLVDGYNSKSVTSVTRSGSTVTVNCTGHGIPDGGIALIAGCTPTDYNGEWYTTYVDANNFTFQISGTPTTPATGTITSKVPGAGWTKQFTGTNKTVYLQATRTSTPQMGIRVDDSTTTYAYFRGAEAWTDVDTATAPFPTVAQMANGPSIIKSATADSTARDWIIVADDKTFYLTITTNTTTYKSACFGLFKSYKSNDLYNNIINGGSSTTVSTFAGQNAFNTISATFSPRSYTQIGTSVAMGKTSDKIRAANATDIGSGGMNYPNPADSSLYVAPFWIGEGSTGVRGHFVGILSPLHSKPLGHGDTFTGNGVLSGRRYMAVNSETGQYFVEISNTWWT